MNLHHSLSNRALAVRGLLGDLWGTQLPNSPDPWLTMTMDGIASDDEVGRQNGFVVLGDGLTVQTVRALVAGHPDATVAMGYLPPSLRDRLVEVVERDQE